MGKFNFIRTRFDGLIIVEPAVFGDERGFFMETYSERDFRANGVDVAFVQDNHSKSGKGVLRGMHFQVKNPQGKLVRVVSGKVFDVAVDIRRQSPTQGEWFGLLLSAENKRQLYVPEGFAHGFYVLSDFAEFTYKCTRFYDPNDESGIRFDDPEIGIEWPESGVGFTVSQKDLALGSYAAVRNELKL